MSGRGEDLTFPSFADPLESWPAPGTLLLETRGDKAWEFAYPRLTSVGYDFFHEAIDAWELGEVQFAEQRYRQLINDYPDFIDVYHHLAMLMDETEREEEAFTLWQHTVEIGLEHFPEGFEFGAHRLPWSLIDNRPFLRAYHGLALGLIERGRVREGLGICLRILDLNPNDNQGVRQDKVASNGNSSNKKRQRYFATWRGRSRSVG